MPDAFFRDASAGPLPDDAWACVGGGIGEVASQICAVLESGDVVASSARVLLQIGVDKVTAVGAAARTTIASRESKPQRAREPSRTPRAYDQASGP